MKYMQVLKEERSGKRLTVEVIDESSDGLDSGVRMVVSYNQNCVLQCVDTVWNFECTQRMLLCVTAAKGLR